MRLRDCEPPPHDSVQVDQGPKDDTTQCVGHACSLQVPACHSRAPSLCHGVREVRLWPAISVDFQIYLILPS